MKTIERVMVRYTIAFSRGLNEFMDDFCVLLISLLLVDQATNFHGPVALTKAFLPAMLERRSGSIAVISSVQGKLGIPLRSSYAGGC